MCVAGLCWQAHKRVDILDLEKMTKRPVLAALLLIFAVAYILRVLYLPQQALTFGYDQARDTYSAQQILNGHLKVQGPPASTPGLNHGVLYFYFLAPGYLIGKGSPLVAAYWAAIWNAMTVFIVFILGWKMTKSLTAALLSAVLFAISYEAIQYAVWLSNPTMGVWLVPLIYLGLWLWVREKKWWAPILCGLALGFSVQAEIFLAYHLPPVLLWLFVSRKNVTRSDIFKFGGAFLLAISTMILSEVKFGFQALKGISALLNMQDNVVLSRGLGDYIVLYLNQIGKVFAYSTYPGNVGYGGALVLVVVILALITWNRKQTISWQPFLATWLFSHILVVSVGGTSTPFLNVGFAPAIALIVGISFALWWKSGKRVLVLVLMLLIVFGNLSRVIKENSHGQTIFSIQKDMTLENQLAAIDYTYQASGGNKFSINTVTSPLWINIVWTYLYKWYGEPKYGYLPLWHGPNQIGQLDSLTYTEQPTQTYFLIEEPLQGIPPRYVQDTIDQEDSRSNVMDEKSFGQIIVQKRTREEAVAK